MLSHNNAIQENQETGSAAHTRTHRPYHPDETLRSVALEEMATFQMPYEPTEHVFANESFNEVALSTEHQQTSYRKQPSATLHEIAMIPSIMPGPSLAATNSAASTADPVIHVWQSSAPRTGSVQLDAYWKDNRASVGDLKTALDALIPAVIRSRCNEGTPSRRTAEAATTHIQALQFLLRNAGFFAIPQNLYLLPQEQEPSSLVTRTYNREYSATPEAAVSRQRKSEEKTTLAALDVAIPMWIRERHKKGLWAGRLFASAVEYISLLGAEAEKLGLSGWPIWGDEGGSFGG